MCLGSCLQEQGRKQTTDEGESGCEVITARPQLAPLESAGAGGLSQGWTSGRRCGLSVNVGCPGEEVYP